MLYQLPFVPTEMRHRRSQLELEGPVSDNMEMSGAQADEDASTDPVGMQKQKTR